MIIAGATPNETTSTSESSSAPNPLPVFGHPRHPAVEHVQHAGEHDEPPRPDEVAAL